MNVKHWNFGGLKVVADKREVFKDDPGAGTPAMVYKGKNSATFFCAIDTGELDCGEVLLSHSECKFLRNIEGDVYEFLGI